MREIFKIVKPYFQRRVNITTIGKFKQNFQESFIKPTVVVGIGGKRITDIKQLDGYPLKDDDEILVTEIVSFLAEWKISVWHGVIDKIFHNKGAWDEFPSSGVVELIVDECLKQDMQDFIVHVGIMTQYYKKRGGQTGERNRTVLINVHGKNECKRSERNVREAGLASV